MIKLENTQTYGWEAAIRGMRNPMNSWDKSDSYWTHIENPETLNTAPFEFFVGDNDHDLMMRLAKAGSDHRKYMRQIIVSADITAPLYWWKEYDTYKVGTVANSCSTMHKIHEKEFTLEDFSTDRMTSARATQLMLHVIDELNENRKYFNVEKDPVIKKNYFNNMIQLLPSSYNQKRTIMLNYEVLRNMYHARKNHKLDEWHTFCDWIKTLPYSEIITGEE